MAQSAAIRVHSRAARGLAFAGDLHTPAKEGGVWRSAVAVQALLPLCRSYVGIIVPPQENQLWACRILLAAARMMRPQGERQLVLLPARVCGEGGAKEGSLMMHADDGLVMVLGDGRGAPTALHAVCVRGHHDRVVLLRYAQLRHDARTSRVPSQRRSEGRPILPHAVGSTPALGPCCHVFVFFLRRNIRRHLKD